MLLIVPPVIGHRGAAGLAPENTLASFALAADLGCAMVEFDVRLSADGVPVVFHDETLERCTNGAGAVAAHGLAALKRLDAGGGERIPTLAEVAELCLTRGLMINIEIKPAPGTAVATTRAALECLGRVWPSERPAPLVSSFSRAALAEARVVAPHWPRGLLAERLPARWHKVAETFTCSSLHLNQRWLAANRVAEIKAAGLLVLGYTVNQPRRAEKLWFRGVSAVFSDRPYLLMPAEYSAVMNFSRLR